MIAKSPIMAYSYDTGEEVDIVEGSSLEPYELDKETKEKSYQYVCLRQARSIWELWNSQQATTEQLKLWISDQKTWHDFLPSFEIPNPILAKILDGEEKGLIVWLDQTAVESSR